MGALRPPDPRVILRVFGIDIAAELASGPWTASEAKVRVESIKARAKKRYRELALEYHPDRSGDDAKMKEVNDAYDWVQRIDIKAKPRPRYLSGNLFVMHTQTTSATDTTTTTTVGCGVGVGPTYTGGEF